MLVHPNSAVLTSKLLRWESPCGRRYRVSRLGLFLHYDQPLFLMTNAVPFGQYTAELVEYYGDDLLGTSPAFSYHLVNEVSLRDGAAVLGLDGGSYVPADQVYALRS